MKRMVATSMISKAQQGDINYLVFNINTLKNKNNNINHDSGKLSHLDLDNSNHNQTEIKFDDMAEAMINEKYMQATLQVSPLLEPQQQQHQQQQQQAIEDKTPNIPHPSNQGRKLKVVGFDLPARKRQKHNVDVAAQNVTAAIQSCVSNKDRLDAIYDACSKFDHGIESAHDIEVAMGADIALFKHLPFLLLKRQRISKENQQDKTNSVDVTSTSAGDDASRTSVDDNSNATPTATPTSPGYEYVSIMEEISNTFTALEMVLRCSADSVSTCFARIGPELLPLMFDFIEELSKTFTHSTTNNHTKNKPQKDMTPKEQDDNESHSDTSTITVDRVVALKQEPNDQNDSNTSSMQFVSNVILKTCTKIMGHFARAGALTETLAKTKGLLTTLHNVISIPEESEFPIEAKLNCLWIIANLACSVDNMTFISRNTKLMKTLFEIIKHPSGYEENHCEDIERYIRLLRTQSVALRAFLNLSWAQENKIPFSQDVELVATLLRVASHRKSSWCGSGRGVSGILLQCRRHAAGTLRNIAAAPRKYKRRLCRLESCDFLETLADIAKNDHDSIVRGKVHATLFNLVSADTAKLFTEKRNVLDVITTAATSANAINNSNEDVRDGNKVDSQAMAVRTLRSLEKALPEDDEGYDVLRPTLSRFDSQITMNRSNSNLGSVNLSVSNLRGLPSISNFSLGDISAMSQTEMV